MYKVQKVEIGEHSYMYPCCSDPQPQGKENLQVCTRRGQQIRRHLQGEEEHCFCQCNQTCTQLCSACYTHTCTCNVVVLFLQVQTNSKNTQKHIHHEDFNIYSVYVLNTYSHTPGCEVLAREERVWFHCVEVPASKR